jgi:hypothetical protein
MQKNTKTVKNSVFAPKNPYFEQLTNPETPFKTKYQGSLPGLQNPKTKMTSQLHNPKKPLFMPRPIWHILPCCRIMVIGLFCAFKPDSC